MSFHDDSEGSSSFFHDGKEQNYTHDEVLPFALNEEPTTTEEMRPLVVQSQRQQAKHLECGIVQASPGSVSFLQSVSSLPPPLMSSMMTADSSSILSDSSRQWGGEASERTGTAMLSSRHLDAAASLMVAGNAYGLHMTMTPDEQAQLSAPQQQQQQEQQPFPSASTTTPPGTHHPYSNLGFSRLMQNAGDVTGDVHATTSGLPVLLEEGTDESFHSACEEQPQTPPSSSFPSNISTTTSQIMTTTDSGWIPVDDCDAVRGSYIPPALGSADQRIHPPSQQQQQQRGLFGRGELEQQHVYARQLDPTSFEVTIDVDPDVTVEDVMDVLGNPSCLVLWNESIRSNLIVTKSSERSNVTNPLSSSSLDNPKMGIRRANYEGEWIEASTTDLISPPSSSSCLYSTSKAMWNFVGFPSHYGDVSMFIERQQGRMGLSIGPFAGDVTVSHSIRVESKQQHEHDQERGGMGTRTRIVNRVTLSRDVTNTDLLCGVLDCLESCFLPSLKGYTDQVVASMIRLRALVETGEGGSQHEGYELINTRRQQIVC